MVAARFRMLSVAKKVAAFKDANATALNALVSLFLDDEC
jgi:hypothetical protein